MFFLIVACERKPVLGIYLSDIYPSNKIVKIRKELDKNITNIFFAEEPGYSISTAQLRFLALPQISFDSLDYDLLYLWKYCLMTQTQLNPWALGFFFIFSSILLKIGRNI